MWATSEFCKKTQKKSYDGDPIEFRKLTQLAAEIITDCLLEKATVLFDSYYLCPNVTHACAAQQYRWAGVAQKNRNFFPDGRDRDKRKLSSYGANALKRLGKWVKHVG